MDPIVSRSTFCAVSPEMAPIIPPVGVGLWVWKLDSAVEAVAWIDLNKDGDFLDAGEEVYSSGRALSTVASGNLTVPADAPAGKTRLRIAMRYNAAPVPCGSFNYGEVEDYSVRLQ